MALNATITLAPPALSDSVVWFANAAAWNNYWTACPATTSISITTTTYTETAYDVSLQPYTLTVDGVDCVLATKAMLDSLKARVDTLNTGFIALKQAFIAAGLITDI